VSLRFVARVAASPPAIGSVSARFTRDDGRPPATDSPAVTPAPTSIERGAHTARILSLVFHPVFTGTYVLVILGVLGGTSRMAGLAWSLLTIAVATALPALDLLLRVRRGSVAGFEVLLREQRTRPLLTTLLCSLIALVLLLLLDGPDTLVIGLLAALVSGAVLTAITRVWKVSFHTATLAGGLALVAWAGGPAGLLGLALLLAVGWARVRLHRHSVGQVIVGAAVGAVVSIGVIALA
jgi:membrane-associated phospholipid phosphatase